MKLTILHEIVEETYRKNAHKVPYHGWHHVKFVVDKSVEYVDELHADETLTTAAALMHDVNYMVRGGSDASAGQPLRLAMSRQAGFDGEFSTHVERIIHEARTGQRHAHISNEAKALSDADTVYKVLPTTPLLAADYLRETGSTLYELAYKIVHEQTPLRESGIYFYSQQAQDMYMKCAIDNLELWTRVLDSMDYVDGDVISVLRHRAQMSE